ncbi:hypothetical protein [Mesobacillus foraminis]|uniref:Uncharacterized protein n=1 Tax=Mesobacillus foraminis TaxID=279826 RepID=A0A4R2BGB1_9BACI|nr:hypothetical protein [Mesobacillus foraminis]TCN24999.1 hypothetical protein EV146_106201 [Mesobacillus foraminis]
MVFKGKRKKLYTLFAAVFVLTLLGVTFLFPYSSLSLNRTVTYDPDNRMVKEYLQSLTDFKDQYKTKKPDDATAHRNPYFLQLFELKWLTSKEPVQMDHQDLDILLLEVKTARQSLMELAFQESYPVHAKIYLKNTIEGCLELEERIEDLQDSKFRSRATLDRQYRNLHVSFINNLGRYSSFYKESRKKE